MNEVERIRVFLRVAELASFTGAALALDLPKGSVSAAIAELEADLGTRLLHRTTRRVALSSDGQAFAERARDLLADWDELTTHFQDDRAGLSGRLRVDMTPFLARDVILPRLPEFLEQHPGLDIELSSTDRLVDLAQEGLDFTIRAGGRTDSTLIARPLGHYQLLNVVSRKYAERFGLPQSLADLSQHRLVHYVSVMGSPKDGFDYVDPESGEERTVPMQGNVTVNSAAAYLAAVRAGLGIVQIPEFGVRAGLKSGELIEVLPEFRASPLPVALVYLNRRHQPRRVRVFMGWVASVVTEHLDDSRV